MMIWEIPLSISVDTTQLKKQDQKKKMRPNVREQAKRLSRQTKPDKKKHFFSCKPIKVYNNIPLASWISPWPEKLK